MPIQDVKTRWNSTFLMLRRAKRLQKTFDAFCSEYDRDDLMLNQEEWRQIEYLLWVTQPFFRFTSALSRTKDVTAHLIFEIYNNLFDHLERSIRQLQRKTAAWKKIMLSALYAAKEKLSKYYGQTDLIYGDLYAIGTILAPENKLHLFSDKDWGEDLRKQYRQSFENHFAIYKEQLAETETTTQAFSPTVATSEINMLLKGKKRHRPSQRDELNQYLDSGK